MWIAAGEAIVKMAGMKLLGEATVGWRENRALWMKCGKRRRYEECGRERGGFCTKI